MSEIATFEKVSFEEYKTARMSLLHTTLSDEEIEERLRGEWESIQLPSRATSGSAGYDFYMPVAASFAAGIPTSVATGVRVKMEPGWVLLLFPRSGLGFKYGMRLVNTVGVIDSDYYNAKNEGHIMAKMLTDSFIHLEKGERFMQGIFIPFGTASNDQDTEFASREGGMGSTGK